MAGDGLIAASELAEEFGTHRSSIFKILKRLGIEPAMQHDAERGGQRVAMATADEATVVRAD